MRKRSGIFYCGGIFRSKKFTPRPVFSPSGRGPVAVRIAVPGPLLSFLGIIARGNSGGGNFLEMSCDYGGITALAGGNRNSNPRRCNVVSERPKTASFPPLPGRLPAACRGRRNVMRIACFQCCSWDARHPQRYWTPIMGAGLTHFLTTVPSQAMRQVPHSRHPA